MTRLTIKRENDRLFRSGHFPAMHSETYTEVAAPVVQRASVYRVAEHLAAEDTISCVLRQAGRHCTALNFANAMFPGGGYVLGGNAQEESLCRASLLYYTIRTQKQFYCRNRLHLLPDYTDTMVYSEGVPILRRSDGTMLETPAACDFLTCPAVNRTFARFLFSTKHCDAVMARRIERIVQLAVSRNPEVIVFGAFGCGAFGNRREVVYPLFEAAINRYVPDTVTVLFADPKADK